jgi:HTH-like domain
MGRNYLAGRDGDRINAVLAAAGYNFSLLLRSFEELLRVLSLILWHALLAVPLHLTRCRKIFFMADYRARPAIRPHGYRKVAALLRHGGWTINDKRVERIWQREGLKVSHKQTPRGRLWLADRSCIRLRPQQRNHVWSYDFVEDRTPTRDASIGCSTCSTSSPMNAWRASSNGVRYLTAPETYLFARRGPHEIIKSRIITLRVAE